MMPWKAMDLFCFIAANDDKDTNCVGLSFRKELTYSTMGFKEIYHNFSLVMPFVCFCL